MTVDTTWCWKQQLLLLYASLSLLHQVGHMLFGSHKLKSISTKYAECKIGHPVRPSSQRVRGIETWEKCRDKCNEDDQCSHFKFKVLNYRKIFLIPVLEHKPNTNTFLQDHRKVRRRLCILMDTVFEEKESWTAGEQFCIDGRNNWKSSVPYSYFQKHLDGSTTTETPSTDHGWLLFIKIIWFWSIWMFRL